MPPETLRLHDIGHKKPRHCSCCGDRILDPQSLTCDNYRLLTFQLSDGSETPVSVCSVCEEEDWTSPERLMALKTQMDDAMDLSIRGQMYTLRDDGEWDIQTVGAALSPEVAEKAMDYYRSLSLVKPLRSGRFSEPTPMVVMG